jgi:hypothetical protein
MHARIASFLAELVRIKLQRRCRDEITSACATQLGEYKLMSTASALVFTHDESHSGSGRSSSLRVQCQQANTHAASVAPFA